MKNNRPEARRAGDDFYLTGRPCKHGHVAPRRTYNYACTDCERVNVKEFNKTEQGRISAKKYRDSDKGKAVRARNVSGYRKTQQGKAVAKNANAKYYAKKKAS